ncbi:MAG: Dabb family protein [Propionibacteriales bacterium]|nr:Dabb family protein [Propionibacteriales bacterium]
MTQAPPVNTSLQHVVLLKFPAPLSEVEAEQTRAMVARWPGDIGTLTELRFGADLTGTRTRGYQFLLVTVFPDADTLAAYVAHPVHQEFVRWLDDHDCERLAFDYYLDESTRFA